MFAAYFQMQTRMLLPWKLFGPLQLMLAELNCFRPITFILPWCLLHIFKCTPKYHFCGIKAQQVRSIDENILALWLGIKINFLKKNSITNFKQFGRKNAPEHVTCLSCLLHIFANLLTKFSLEASTVDLDRITGAVWSGSTLLTKRLLKNFTRQWKQTTCVGIDALRVNLNSLFSLLFQFVHQSIQKLWEL